MYTIYVSFLVLRLLYFVGTKAFEISGYFEIEIFDLLFKSICESNTLTSELFGPYFWRLYVTISFWTF
jgi:hypothetical protein